MAEVEQEEEMNNLTNHEQGNDAAAVGLFGRILWVGMMCGGTVLIGLIAMSWKKYGHSKTLTNITLYFILSGLAINFILLEIVFMALTPVRILKRMVLGDQKLDPDRATRLANGKDQDLISERKVVIFDGVCVLCNFAGRFVVSHLPDPNLVSFLPYQDALANPHISLRKLKAEFSDFDETLLQNKICVVSGKKLLWASDAVLEVCSWMYFPYFPFMKIGYLVPSFIRNAAYMVVAENRYSTFGTQPLEQNFAKYLCPYIYVKKYIEVAPAAAAAGSEKKTD